MAKEIDEKAIALIEKKIAPIAKQAAAIKITTPDEMKSAAEMLTELNKYGDEMKSLKETITKPMNAALKAARELFKPRESKLDDAVQALRGAMSSYQMIEDKKAAEAEKKLADRVEKGTMKPETAVRKMGELDRPEAQIETAGGSGSVKFRTVKKLVIDNVPDLVNWIVRNGKLEAIEVSERHVLDMLKGGLPVVGAHIEEVKEVVNSR